MMFSKTVIVLFTAFFFITTATSTSKNGVSLSPSTKTYVPAGTVYGDERPLYPFLARYPRFARRVRHLSLTSYNAMITQVYNIFLHCIKMEQLIARVYLNRATDQSAASTLAELRNYTQTKDQLLATMQTTYGVSYDEVPFFGSFRYTRPNNIPRFRGLENFDNEYGFNANLRGNHRRSYLTRAFNIYVLNLEIVRQTGLIWRNQLLGRGSLNYDALNLVRQLRRRLAVQTNNFRGFYRLPFFGNLNRFGRQFGPTGFGTLARRGFVVGRPFVDPTYRRDLYGPGRFAPIRRIGTGGRSVTPTTIVGRPSFVHGRRYSPQGIRPLPSCILKLCHDNGRYLVLLQPHLQFSLLRELNLVPSINKHILLDSL